MNAELRSAHFARLQRQREGRKRSVHVGKLQIPVLERPGEQIGTVVWPGAHLLAEALAAHDTERRWPPQGCAGARVIELGSGVGLCGIAAAMLGADVTLTERSDVLPLLSLNVQDGDVQQQVRRAGGTARVRELNWGADGVHQLLASLAPHQQKASEPASGAVRAFFDLILGADIVYTQAPLGALHDTVCALCPPGSSTTLLLAYRQRDAAIEARFFEALRGSGFVLVRSFTEAPEQQGREAQKLLAFRRQEVPSIHASQTDQ